jgi:hypothetical protein
MNLFFAKKARHKIKSLYASWQDSNISAHTKYLTLIHICVMALMVPFDFILFGLNAPYPKFRILSIAFFALNLLALQYVSRMRKPTADRKASALLLFPNLYWNILYHYFMCTASPENIQIVLIGNLLVSFFTTFLTLRFWREQYLLNLVSILSLSVFAIGYPSVGRELALIIICHLLSFMLAFILRREFAGAMYERYYHMMTFIPKQVAHSILTSSGTLKISEVFKTENRFTVCLVSDLRNYQELCKRETPEYVSRLLEKFYDIIFECLDQVVPEGNYFANWTADELFVVFYSEDNDEEKVMNEALSFSKLLATTLHQRALRELESPLMWDIGLASGVGLLGVQGPERLKKTTITGESPGLAKRLESEAKRQRLPESSIHELPILVMDRRLKDFGIRYRHFESDSLQEFVATEKNISGEKYFRLKSSIPLFIAKSS